LTIRVHEAEKLSLEQI
jgi:CRP-like cAMP-binding protein